MQPYIIHTYDHIVIQPYIQPYIQPTIHTTIHYNIPYIFSYIQLVIRPYIQSYIQQPTIHTVQPLPYTYLTIHTYTREYYHTTAILRTCNMNTKIDMHLFIHDAYSSNCYYTIGWIQTSLGILFFLSPLSNTGSSVMLCRPVNYLASRRPGWRSCYIGYSNWKWLTDDDPLLIPTTTTVTN